jgi:hypothetical protein
MLQKGSKKMKSISVHGYQVLIYIHTHTVIGPKGPSSWTCFEVLNKHDVCKNNKKLVFTNTSLKLAHAAATKGDERVMEKTASSFKLIWSHNCATHTHCSNQQQELESLCNVVVQSPNHRDYRTKKARSA